jgi:hypothetical protein
MTVDFERYWNCNIIEDSYIIIPPILVNSCMY